MLGQWEVEAFIQIANEVFNLIQIKIVKSTNLNPKRYDWQKLNFSNWIWKKENSARGKKNGQMIPLTFTGKEILLFMVREIKITALSRYHFIYSLGQILKSFIICFFTAKLWRNTKTDKFLIEVLRVIAKQKRKDRVFIYPLSSHP